jgi:hypothetical protein
MEPTTRKMANSQAPADNRSSKAGAMVTVLSSDVLDDAGLVSMNLRLQGRVVDRLPDGRYPDPSFCRTPRALSARLHEVDVGGRADMPL